MEKYKVTFVQEKQFLLGNAFVRVFIDGEARCDLKIRTGDSAELELAYGLHHMTVVGYSKQIDGDIFVRDNGTITLRWNKTWGRPEVADMSTFRPSKEELSADKGERASVIINAGGREVIVIQLIREVTGLSLKEAKQLYGRMPCVVKSDISLAEAESVKNRFESIGVSATVDKDGSAQLISGDTSLPVDASFGVTKAVGNYLWINENKKTVGVPRQNLFGKVTGVTAFRFEEIVDFELIQDGSSIINKGGLGRAAVGGLLFGGSGAVVGSVTGSRKQTQTCTELRIKITVNRMADPTVYIDFIKGVSYKKDSLLYRQLADNAEKVMSMLKIVADSASAAKEGADTAASSDSAVDEIRKYKQLLDEGIITEEEFRLKKRQLMNI